MKSNTFNKTRLATCLSLILGATLSPAFAQDAVQGAEEVEVIQVSGIRSSQIRAMDVKRSSDGVVDAISAEDIGKFPDTNLAESLQRITGVSIDRQNGEGSKVTVRGFGPDFNLVLLNNRVMPTAQVSGESTRSFEFANLASDSVSAVEIYKTGKADVASGGIGSTINIQTARPLSSKSMVASFGVKAHHDTSVESGDNLTPEISGIVSNTFMDNKLGLGLSASYQKRDSNVKRATIDGWRQNIHGDLNPNAVVEDNNKNPYGNTFYARNVGFATEDIERERANAQFVVQYAPVENLEITADYTYSQLEDVSSTDTWGLWFSGPGNATSAHINENGTFDRVTEVDGDYSGTMNQNASKNRNTSLGLNIDWQASEQLSFSLDMHDSEAVSEGGLDNYADNIFFILGALNVSDKTYDATSTDIPLLGANYANLNPAGEPHLLPEHYASLFAGVRAGRNETDVQQTQFDGSWVNPNDSALASIDFGLSYLSMQTHAQASYTGPISAGWYGNMGLWKDDVQFVGLGSDFLSDFSGGGSEMLIPYYYSYDQAAAMQKAEGLYDVEYVAAPWQDDHNIEEKTKAVYIQANIQSELYDMPLDVVAGLRYEQTDVTASSMQQEAQQVVWLNPTEWQTLFSDDFTFSHETHDYSELLPSLDLRLELREDLITRVSYSKTITRPTLGSMRATTSLTPIPKVGSRTGFAGNPALKPYSSDNIDLSVEYYYDDASYLSVGWFNKDVENFLMNTISTEQYDHLRDPFMGPAAEQARAELIANNQTPSDEAVFQWLLDNGYGNDENRVVQSDNDPVATWNISKPNNVEDLSIRGWELAWQHWLWDTGLGFSLNYTKVNGDTEYDVQRTDEQFALPGLSDSANFAVFYEDERWQARLAYNWRDDFLSDMGQAEAGGPAPQFTEAYGQLDLSVSYQVNEELVVFFEGINILEQEKRVHGRFQEQMLLAQQNDARYALGLRYTF
ncbi:TonB-dependent receptor [Bowmanella yangjiangensis]|uniref:TonB-dependent receptor n=1 Tax=Bowmanella yangjiangensis TaxID=2811230 RepID=A0ABS3CYV6_9ALTE|nr:TonB-dependent receptor [Bowmanella yangjiangensis]MBN7821729.1 TonB-dependent receptor [Bowmanella yangjiangensis]